MKFHYSDINGKDYNMEETDRSSFLARIQRAPPVKTVTPLPGLIEYYYDRVVCSGIVTLLFGIRADLENPRNREYLGLHEPAAPPEDEDTLMVTWALSKGMRGYQNRMAMLSGEHE